jgi:hypothetical protein
MHQTRSGPHVLGSSHGDRPGSPRISESLDLDELVRRFKAGALIRDLAAVRDQREQCEEVACLELAELAAGLDFKMGCILGWSVRLDGVYQAFEV